MDSVINKLKKEIIDDIKECDLILDEQPPLELFDLISKIVEVGNNNDKSKLCDISNYDMFLAIFASSNTDEYAYQDIVVSTLPYKDIINNWNYDKSNSHLEFILKYLNEDEKRIRDEKFIKHFNALGLPQEFLNYNLGNMSLVMISFLEFKESIKMTKNIANPLHLNGRIIHPQSKMMCAEIFYQFVHLDTYIPLMNEYINDNKEEQKFRKNATNKRKQFNNEILSMIEDKSIYDLIDIKEDYLTYLNPLVLNRLLLIVNYNISNEYKLEKKINERLESIIESSPLSKYLYSRNINPQNIDSNILNNLEQLNIDNTINNIEFLLDIGFSTNEIFNTYINLLTTLDKNIINKIKYFIDNNIISRTTILNNPNILDTLYKRLTTNYSILSSIIDFKNQYYKDSLLLIKTNELKNRLSVLKEYDLTINNYIYLLCNYEFINIYDLILEQEIPKNLFISICNNPNPKNIIKRIMISKMLDIAYVSQEFNLTSSCLSEDKFICLDDELDDFFISTNKVALEYINGDNIEDIKDNELIRYLDENNLYNHDTYMIGESLISRPKLLKNLQLVKNDNLDKYLLPSIISNSIFNEKDLFNILEFTQNNHKMAK